MQKILGNIRIIVMMILRKPLSILTAILFLTSPLILSAQTTDSLQVVTQTEEITTEEAHVEVPKTAKDVVTGVPAIVGNVFDVDTMYS